MDWEVCKSWSPILLRISLSLVFLWFGFNQILDASSWIIFLPEFLLTTSIPPESFVILNGLFEVLAGLFLIIGLYTRWVALLLALHLFPIAFSLGYNDVTIRDLGLALATFSIFMQGADWACMEQRRVSS